MATTPFSDDLVEKLKGATAWWFRVSLGVAFTPRFFCCTNPNDLGIVDGKEPVAVMELMPNPSFPGDNVTFDGTESYDPDGSITDYTWTFEDGTPSSSTADDGTVSWADPGEYEVTLIVTDGTTKNSAPARRVQRVREPAGSYFIGTDTGVYFTDDGGQTWTARNTDLSGDALVVNDLKIDPATQHLDHTQKTIWAATNGGVYVSNNGGQAWTQKNPASVSNQWSDSPAPAIGDLAFQKLWFADDRLFAGATWQNGSSDYRSWLFYTDDAGAMRTDTSQTVSWSEIATGWDA